MTLKMKYNSHAMFHHPITLPEFKILRKYLDDSCAKHDVLNIIMYANQLIPDRISEVGTGETPNIVELDTADEANKIDLSVYRWSERMSAKRNRYIFVLRQIKRNKVISDGV